MAVQFRGIQIIPTIRSGQLRFTQRTRSSQAGRTPDEVNKGYYHGLQASIWETVSFELENCA